MTQEQVQDALSYNYAVPVGILQECRKFLGNKPYDQIANLNKQNRGLGLFDNLQASRENPDLALLDLKTFETLLNLIGIFPYVEVYKIMEQLKNCTPLPRELPEQIAEAIRPKPEDVALPDEDPAAHSSELVEVPEVVEVVE